MAELYKRIAALCEARGINVTQLCRAAGVSRASLTDLKMGRKQSLSAQTLQKLASYFGVTVDYLLAQEPALVNDDAELTELLELLKTRPECRMLFQLSRDATKEDVEQAVRIIEALRK